MKNIEILCFKTDDSCEVVSSSRNIQINDITEQKFFLQIDNESNQDCEVSLSAKSEQNDQLLKEINLLISNGQNIIFQDNLAKFFTEKIDLQLIKSKSKNNYLFTLDSTSLLSIKQNLHTNFDLFFDFNCVTFQEEKISIQSSLTASQGAVLASHSLFKQEETKQPSFSLLLLFLSSLFVLIFFVIIKIVHGKKKTKKG